MRHKNSWPLIGFACALTVGSLHRAEAYTARRAGLQCMDRAQQGQFGGDPGAYTSPSLGAGRQTLVTCPVENTSTHPSMNFATADVYVFDNSSSQNFSAMACAEAPDTGVYSCGAATSNSGTGFRDLHLSLSAWSMASDYVYIQVVAPSDSTGNLITGFLVST